MLGEHNATAKIAGDGSDSYPRTIETGAALRVRPITTVGPVVAFQRNIHATRSYLATRNGHPQADLPTVFQHLLLDMGAESGAPVGSLSFPAVPWAVPQIIHAICHWIYNMRANAVKAGSYYPVLCGLADVERTFPVSQIPIILGSVSRAIHFYNFTARGGIREGIDVAAACVTLIGGLLPTHIGAPAGRLLPTTFAAYALFLALVVRSMVSLWILYRAGRRLYGRFVRKRPPPIPLFFGAGSAERRGAWCAGWRVGIPGGFQ